MDRNTDIIFGGLPAPPKYKPKKDRRRKKPKKPKHQKKYKNKRRK